MIYLSNKEIFQELKNNRDVAAFARFLGISPQWLYAILKREEPTKNQSWNFIRFITAKYKGEL